MTLITRVNRKIILLLLPTVRVILMVMITVLKIIPLKIILTILVAMMSIITASIIIDNNYDNVNENHSKKCNDYPPPLFSIIR